MKILLVNKFYYPQGGAEKHVFDLKALLESRGHKVVMFAVRDPRNMPSPEQKYFVSPVDFSRVRFGWQGLRVAARMLYSRAANRQLERLIRDERPDIAHLHNVYHQLPPSILSVLKKHHIPTVMTLHDYKLISPNYALYDHGAVCERSIRGAYYRTITHRCVKNSYLASTLAAVTMYIHRWRKYYQIVDCYISPSRFLIGKVKQSGLPVRRLECLPNFIAANEAPAAEPGDYFIAAGRISEEKGYDTTLAAVRGTDLSLKIVGDGPALAGLKEFVARNQMNNVEFTGRLGGAALRMAIRQARAVLVPSIWYENCPLAVLEAYREGRAVIGSRIGGIPELIVDGRTGLLVSPGSATELRQAMSRLWREPKLANQLGQQAYEQVQSYNPERYYDSLMKIYQSILSPHALSNPN
ncbi:MAG: glycosyltransferase [Patescibacteria group bacterium]|jgi:glycosyltransferase involved in cell wall biosynthesis